MLVPSATHIRIARELNVTPAQVATVAELLAAGNTIPFLARYRLEVTGGADETVLRAIEKSVNHYANLQQRRETILASLAEQGISDPVLLDRVQGADSLQVLEDLYLPFRPKRRTKASVAKEQGLTPLAAWILQPGQNGDPLREASRFVSADKGVATPEAALAGARDIIAEQASERADLRQFARTRGRLAGELVAVKGGDDPQERFRTYYDYRERVAQAAPHRVLAVNRGEALKALNAHLELPDAEILAQMERLMFPARAAEPVIEQVRSALRDGYKRLLSPAIIRELRQELSDRAEAHAIEVFKANLRRLLLQPPLRGQTVLAIDPGFRTGCKVVVVDPFGKPLMDGIAIYPHQPQQQVAAARKTLTEIARRHAVTLIAIGNGTAGRETEIFVAEWLAEAGLSLGFVVVDEAGASVWSASPEASTEFPDLEATQRGTISLARRLQDPLAELVKIDVKSIGIGQYQHDVDQKALQGALDEVVESVVNAVGVEVNSASAALLQRVAGLSPRVAGAVVQHRLQHGPFRHRQALRKVKGLGDVTFTQCAGFLRILGGDEPLDRTAIHPESYDAVRTWLKQRQWRPDDVALSTQVAAWRQAHPDWGSVATAMGVGVPTLHQIVDNLEKPGRDPRDGLPPPPIRHGVMRLEELTAGMVLHGVVRNVVDFGAFVDVGVKVAGLIHKSRLGAGRVRHPLDVISVGDQVQVEVLEVDVPRQRLALAIKA
ncbi:MAG: RNA-binding transcriptional accessory protein [Candidatus Sericytochromatia bacterium]|nr:RNA-binding transcriptional accessory protein [Candidatus Sericytochromatia bacterium]